jgi:hypothetical protein
MANTTVDQQALRAMGFPDDMIQHIVAMNYYKNNGEPEAAQQYLTSFVQKCQQLAAQNPGKYPAVNKLPADVIRKNPAAGFDYYVGYIANNKDGNIYAIGTTGLPAITQVHYGNKKKVTEPTFSDTSSDDEAMWFNRQKLGTAFNGDFDQRPDVTIADATRKGGLWQASGGITRLRKDAGKTTKAILNGLATWAEDPVTAANELNKYIAYRNTPEYVDALDTFCTRICYKANSVPEYKQLFIDRARELGALGQSALFEWLKESYPNIDYKTAAGDPKQDAKVTPTAINRAIYSTAGSTRVDK